MPRLILVRHGQSVWNASNRFTGWTDVDLSDQGVEEAEEAGRELSAIRIDVVHTSDLVRAQRTAGSSCGITKPRMVCLRNTTGGSTNATTALCRV